MQRIGAIVQARMSSRRLPGKILKEIHGKPLLLYITESLAHCSTLCDLVIATSAEESDDPVETFCKDKNLQLYRGSLNNVASRFLEISRRRKWDAFVRVNGDSPLIDPQLVDRGAELFCSDRFDLVTNVFPRTFPPGQSVEVVNCATFQSLYSVLSSEEDFEHVTRYFYQNPDEFRIKNFTSETDYSRIHLAVDTPEDFRFISSIISKMHKPHWEYHVSDIVEIIKMELNG